MAYRGVGGGIPMFWGEKRQVSKLASRWRDMGPPRPPQKEVVRRVGKRRRANQTYPGVQSGKDGADGKEVVVLTKGHHRVGAAPSSKEGRGRVRCLSLRRWGTLEVLGVKPIGRVEVLREEEPAQLRNVELQWRPVAHLSIQQPPSRPSLSLYLETAHVGEMVSGQRQTLGRHVLE